MTEQAQAQKRKFKAAHGAEAASHERELNRQVAELVKRYTAEHRDELAKLRVIPNIRVRIKSPNSSAMIKTLIRRIISAEGARATQAAIRRYAQSMHPQTAVYKDWGRTLPPYARKYAAEFIQGSDPVFASLLPLPKEVTLNVLHAYARVAFFKARTEGRSYKAEIIVSEEALIIANRSHRITESKTGDYTYKIARINIEQLEESLMKQNTFFAKNSTNQRL